MKWLPKERQVPFIGVLAGTVVLVLAIYFVLIRSQHESLAKLTVQKAAADKQLGTYKTTIKNSAADAQKAEEATKALAVAEADMASGDLVFWTYDMMRRLKQQYKIEIPDIGRPMVSDVDFLPTFPYKQAKFSVSGTAYYHDLGKFISDFENKYPHARIVNLGIEPDSSASEKLSFRMQIIVLVKNQS